MADAPTELTTTDPAEDEPPKETDDTKLGPAGEKALADERKARRASDKALKDAQAELEKIRSETATEQEKAIAAAKAEGRTEALTVANARLLRAEVTALAAGKLSDPADAVRLLDLEDFAISDDGDVDKKAISAAIDGLVEEKPYLAGRGGRPSGDGGGGPRGEPPAPSMDDWIRDKAARR